MLRIGIVVESEKIPGWADEAIREIGLNPNIHWVAVVRIDLPKRRHHFAFQVFRKIDRLLLPGKHSSSLKEDLRFLDEIPTLHAATDLSEIAKIKIDILLHVGAETPPKELISLAKFGIWYVVCGNIKPLDPELAGFHEWFQRQPITEVSLIHLDLARDDERLVSQPIKTEYLSLSRNQTGIFAKAVDILVREILKLANSEKLQGAQKINTITGAIKKTQQPDLWISFHAVAKLFYRAFVKSLSKIFFIEQWVLFYSFASQEFPKLEFCKFKTLVPPKDRIWADPFVVSENGKHYVFIEELMIKSNRGHLSCLVLNSSGEIETSQVIIDRPYHLSYPFIFQHQKTWYMIPESGENNTVDLFECVEFPFVWKQKQSLLTHLQAYDTTLHFQDDIFWLFCTLKKRDGASTDDDLYIFYSKDFLSGEWKAHPCNPVLSDPASARPAGRIFVHNNTLYRPSQIGVPRYGYGLSLNKILELTETSYREEIVSQALPDWRKDLQSVHTLNFSESITLIDGQLKRFKF